MVTKYERLVMGVEVFSGLSVTLEVIKVLYIIDTNESMINIIITKINTQGSLKQCIS